MARQSARAFRGPAESVRCAVSDSVAPRHRVHLPLHGRQRWWPIRHIGSQKRAHDLHSLWRSKLGWRVGLGRRVVMGWLLRRRLLGRGWLLRRRRRIGELVMPLTNDDRVAIAAAIRAAEQRTCGQIVCVLARSSSDYSAVPIQWAAVLALIVPWPLIYFTQLTVQRIFLAQIVVFIVAALILSWSPLRMALVPRAVRRARAHRGAIEQFFLRGLANTRHRCGVLIFVSMAEHYARIVADEGIASKVGRSEWQDAVDALIQHMRNGQIAEGFIAAIDRCGAVLAAHAPPADPPDELPDRIFVLS